MEQTQMPTVFTVGHSNKSIEELLALLAENDIDTIVDCRTRPYSRFNPHFNKNRLEESVPAAGMRYEPRGDNLGGLDKNVNFTASIDEMVKRAKGGERIALMCSEASYKKCHRGDTLTQPILKRGLPVTHIEWKGDPTVITPDTPVTGPDSLF